MKKLVILSCIALCISTTHAQWKKKKIKGNGTIVTNSRTTSDYDKITLLGWFNMEIIEGKEGQITLKGEENLLDYIKTEVTEGKLVVKVKDGIHLKPSIRNTGILITVPVESVSAVELSGSGDITGKKTITAPYFETTMTGSGDINLKVEAEFVKTNLTGSGDISLNIEAVSVKANMTGSGDINLSGSTGNFDAYISGSGDIKAYQLEANNVDAGISGSADIKIYVKDNLKARVSGSGDINYLGDPKTVDAKTSGSGDISKG